jgi:WD40 repeat protein
MANVPTTRLNDFAFQTLVAHVPDDSRKWFVSNALASLCVHLELPKRISTAASSIGFSNFWDKPPKQVNVGINVRGFKKTSRGKEIVVDYAAFHPKTGAILSWSPSLSPDPDRRRSISFRFVDPKVAGPFELDAALAARLKAMNGAKVAPAPPSQTTPFSHDKRLFAVNITPDERFIASVAFDGRLAIWDAKTGARTANPLLAKGLAFLNAIAMAPDSKSLVVGPRKLTQFAIPSGATLRTFDGHPNGEVQDVQFSPSGKLLASASGIAVKGKDNSIAIWDVATGKLRQRWKLGGHQGFRVAFLNDKTLFALTTRRDTLLRLDLGTAEPTAVHAFESEISAADLAVSDAGVWVTVDDVRLFDARDLTLKRTLAVSSSRSALSRDGKRLAVMEHTGVAIVDLVKPTKPRRLARGEEDVRCLAWTPSGSLLCGIGTRVVQLAVK